MASITREIGIDCGHRVPLHASHCRNLHGHRYRVLATVEGDLIQSGSQSGMVLDFGFLKAAMMDCIHDKFDHKLILYKRDVLLQTMFNPHTHQFSKIESAQEFNGSDGIKVVIVPFVPTAENLAQYWFALLDMQVTNMAVTYATEMQLVKVDVYETPNSLATFEVPYVRKEQNSQT